MSWPLFGNRSGAAPGASRFSTSSATAEFWSLPFKVGPAVLVPRPDTEVLVEEALGRAGPRCSVLDVGTGSGAIAVALASELPEAQVTGRGQLRPRPWLWQPRTSGRTASKTGSPSAEQDLLRQGLPGGAFDIILSNPPYVPEGDMAGLMPEVRDFEPRQALCGGADGLDFYRRLIPGAVGRLNAGGWLLFEVGIDQAGEVLTLFEESGGYVDLFSARDTAGIERVVGGDGCRGEPPVHPRAGQASPLRIKMNKINKRAYLG